MYLSTCVLFNLLMESVNGAQFLNITFYYLFLLFGAEASASVFGTVIASLTIMYVTL